MGSSQPQDCPGLRQRTMELMEKSFMSKYDSGFHRALTAMCAFVPYSFKELKDVNVVDFSAMRQFGILQYIASLQRHCVPSDVFFFGIFNTDASDERLLITGADGRSNVIGWSEVTTAFGGEHSDEDEFRGTKIMHRQLLPYKPSAFLPETVEKNLNKGLVSGKDYEEVLYYREAAPYGPTYYLMTLIAEVFWSHSRSYRFLMPQVYAYVRALHGHPYNWAKAIVKSLKSEITYLQREARSAKDSRKTIQVVWGPVFVHLLYTFRHQIFADLADQVDKTPKKLLPKKSKPTKLKRQKANTGGPRVRLVSKKPNGNGGQPRKSVSPTTITNIADLASTLSEDVKHILENRYQSLISQLDNGPENGKEKFQALQQSKAAEDGAPVSQGQIPPGL
ncbi:hypothetical protein R1sor_007387 [Riccia sorocarpa]|uniref:Uncharacterized protein n=1 Tax=Riccia sorocarpa TaxID=122646 RepID=A0ABD3HS11_9MARC